CLPLVRAERGATLPWRPAQPSSTTCTPSEPMPALRAPLHVPVPMPSSSKVAAALAPLPCPTIPQRSPRTSARPGTVLPPTPSAPPWRPTSPPPWPMACPASVSLLTPASASASAPSAALPCSATSTASHNVHSWLACPSWSVPPARASSATCLASPSRSASRAPSPPSPWPSLEAPTWSASTTSAPPSGAAGWPTPSSAA
ncbi:MAG: Dihydropteroate synthase, partial [uncultured Chloroflexi bacterium]